MVHSFLFPFFYISVIRATSKICGKLAFCEAPVVQANQYWCNYGSGKLYAL